MADDKDQDESQKTEQPTAHRLQEAEKKGQTAYSKEVGHVVILLFLGLFVVLISGKMFTDTVKVIRPFLEHASQIVMGKGSLEKIIGNLLADLFHIIFWPLIILGVVLFLAGGLQTKFIFALEKVKPKMSNLSPMEGLKRIFGMKPLIEFLKNLFKIAIVSGLVYFLLIPRFNDIDYVQLLSLQQLLINLKAHIGVMFFTMLAISFILAIGDYLIQRFQMMKQLRMSHQEIKDEHKDLEGDPQIKAKLKEIRRKRSREGMMQAVPTADVIITNPTHYSIALKYDPYTMDAPIVVAKGVDFMALKIREIARKNKIPLVENITLARSLYQNVDVGDVIPETFYKAVARIIRYVTDLKNPENKQAS